MRFANSLVVMTAASLWLAPIAAQAGTKASAAIATSPGFATRLSIPVEDKNRARPREIWLAVLAVVAAGYGAYDVPRVLMSAVLVSHDKGRLPDPNDVPQPDS
jgi:hypothetical protein